ncbi:hypothetical protein [Flavobacterium sp. LB2P53]|uniref:hypothetical protein n=1 Tax=Flavobacterium sp. LB2P53 TaxID=2497481 RepID=UPI000F820643|nr:hypothetical protein [Flavobacterium sp. LB2P53]RTY64391.1 hypothetical protein EKL95_14525 [Flavobacterium sp. LB2P53]
MKPIKTKVTPDQIMALEKLMNQIEDYKAISLEEKVTRSVLFDISDKIHARYRKIIKSVDLFSNKKLIGLELKFHEGYALYSFIQIFLPKIPNQEKAHNDLLKLSLDLHQKLQQ